MFWNRKKPKKSLLKKFEPGDILYSNGLSPRIYLFLHHNEKRLHYHMEEFEYQYFWLVGGRVISHFSFLSPEQYYERERLIEKK